VTETPVPDRVVVVAVADMHEGPTSDSPLVSQALLGENVGSLERSGDWVRISGDDAYPGWVAREALAELGTAGRYPSSDRGFVISGLFANLYSEPDVTRRRPAITAPFGVRLSLESEGEGPGPDWVRLRLPDGRPVWLRSGDGSSESRPLGIRGSIALARRFLGLPYLWGGRSTFGFDCSGFTQLLARARGIRLPRDAHLQAAGEGGVEVPPDQLRAGDFLYFGAGPDRVTHTGMYIGRGQYVHASTQHRPGVQVGRLGEEPTTRNLVGARRFAPERRRSRRPGIP